MNRMATNPALPQATGFLTKYEAPTWLVAIAIYAAWGLLVVFHRELPWWVLLALGSYVIAWHYHLQHEAIHSWRSVPEWLRRAVVWPPLGIWQPYELYRRSHSTHHLDEQLTRPGIDPESFYHPKAKWPAYSPVQRAVHLVNQTFLGRLLIGPLVRLHKMVVVEGGRLARRDFSNLPLWGRHLVGCVVILWFVIDVNGMTFWEYLLYFLYLGLSISMLRALTEHRWGEKPEHRIALIESNWVFGLLYLWNNLHLVHHLYPSMPWFYILDFYRENKEELLETNKHFHFRGYGELARRWGVVPVYIPSHPVD